MPQDAVKVGMIGRVNEWKGQDDFLDALTPLLSKYPNLYLFIVGSAFKGQEWRVNKLKNKIKALPNHDRIIFSEFRKDNYAIEHFFDILILPSTSPDPLPTVVLEAMGCGTPVVGYNHGGVTEMIRNGKDGILVQVKNIDDLRNKVNDLIKSNKYTEMGMNAHQRQKENFSLEKFINNFEKLYNQLI